MKVLLLVALALAAVVAEPEAEANADAYYGYPHGYYQSGLYSGYYGHPYRYGHHLALPAAVPTVAVEAKPVEEGKVALTGHPGYNAYYGYPHHFGHYLGKRSADSEPTADADADSTVNFQLGPYGYNYVLGQNPVPFGPLLDTKTAEEAKNVFLHPYAGVYGHPLALPALPTAVAAEAKPEEEADAKKVVLPIVGHPAYPYGYPAVPYGAVPHLLGKREAEAEAEAAPEADPWYAYGGYPSGYYGYRGYLGYPHTLPALPTVAAEAKPAEEAEAKTVVLTGHPGYNYGYPILGNRYYGGYGTRGYYYG